jgi:hypothetical protein
MNGGQTRPLTPHALGVLRQLAAAPVLRLKINPGVVDRLTREPDPLAEEVDLPSPFKVHKGGKTRWLQITDAGRALLAGEASRG